MSVNIDGLRLALGDAYADVVRLVEEHQEELPFDFLDEAQNRLHELRRMISVLYLLNYPDDELFNNLAESIHDLPDPEEVLHD
jgi:Mg2+ and Co2+ transporter CorA